MLIGFKDKYIFPAQHQVEQNQDPGKQSGKSKFQDMYLRTQQKQRLQMPFQNIKFYLICDNLMMFVKR